MVSVDVYAPCLLTYHEAVRAQELCESRDGHPGFPVPNSPFGLCGRKATVNFETQWGESEFRSCVKVEVDVLGSPSLMVRTVSVDVKRHTELEPSSSELRSCVKAEVADGFCGRKATLKQNKPSRSQSSGAV